MWGGGGVGRRCYSPSLVGKQTLAGPFGDIIVRCDFYLPRANFVTREKTQTQQSYSSSLTRFPPCTRWLKCSSPAGHRLAHYPLHFSSCYCSSWQSYCVFSFLLTEIVIKCLRNFDVCKQVQVASSSFSLPLQLPLSLFLSLFSV